jgi:DNA-binding IclR family transcriptional regulator
MDGMTSVPRPSLSDASEHRTVTRIAAILESVAASPDGMRLGELTGELDAPKSSVHGLVRGLTAIGYLAQRDGRYLLGPAVAGLAATGQSSIVDAARPYMERLQHRYDETVMLGSKVGEALVYLDTIESTQAVRYSPPRVRRHFESPSSIMKLYLAQLEPHRLDEYLNQHVSDQRRRETLREELADVRERRVAFNRGDTFPDLSAAAAGINDRGGLVACIAIGGPSHRIDDQLEQMAAALKTAASEISERIRGPQPKSQHASA